MRSQHQRSRWRSKSPDSQRRSNCTRPVTQVAMWPPRGQTPKGGFHTNVMLEAHFCKELKQNCDDRWNNGWAATSTGIRWRQWQVARAKKKQDRQARKHLTVRCRYGAAIHGNSKHTTVHVPKGATCSTAVTRLLTAQMIFTWKFQSTRAGCQQWKKLEGQRSFRLKTRSTTTIAHTHSLILNWLTNMRSYVIITLHFYCKCHRNSQTRRGAQACHENTDLKVQNDCPDQSQG